MKTEITFEDYLKKGNLSGNTIESYLWTVNYFTTNYEKVSKENLLAYKGYLMEHFKPKTVNLRIQAINKYLEYLEKPQLRLKAVKICTIRFNTLYFIFSPPFLFLFYKTNFKKS